MKRNTTSKTRTISAAQQAAALAAAPDVVHDPDCPYDSGDEKAMEAFWAKGTVRRPGERGAQKAPTKVAVTVRYSPQVIDFFKATGKGWQSRMNEVLLEYLESDHALNALADARANEGTHLIPVTLEEL